MQTRSVDVVVVGGGINGVGVARDCALRGLRVALFEKHDFGFGASGNNSGMIHGGPRYLLTQPEVTRDACIDSGYIQHIAAHMVFRIPFIFPVEHRSWKSRFELAAVDAFFSFYDEFQPLKKGRPHALLRSIDLPKVYPGLRGEFVGAVAFDEWGIDGARLCVLNAIDAEAHGAQIYNHCEVTDLQPLPTGGFEVSVKYGLEGQYERWQTRSVVNATGAWTDRFLGATGIMAKSSASKPLVRPGKGIHVLYDRRFSNYGLITTAIDGRQIFLMPWQSISWIATTDDDFFGSPDDVQATDDEVAYLINGIEHIYPDIKKGHKVGTTVGVRPTLYAYGKLEDKLSRDHAIVEHQPKCYSMIGGKLASYRIFAEEMTDRLVADLSVQPKTRSTTHVRPLPGSDGFDAGSVRRDVGDRVDLITRERLISRYGTRAIEVIGQANTEQACRLVCRCESVLEAEVVYACRVEKAKTLDDIKRRTGLGTGLCGGEHCLRSAAKLLAEIAEN